MPYYKKRKRSYSRFRRRKRSYRSKRALARTYLRKWVRRRRRRRRRPTLRRVAAGVKTLFKRSKMDKRLCYFADNNQLVSGDTDWHVLFRSPINSIPAYTAGGDPMKMREQDNETAVCLRSRIRIRISANPIESEEIQPYFVMLCKTNNGRGTAAGIQMPQVSEFFDMDSVPAGNTLPIWKGFRLVTDNGQEILKNTTVLKTWSGHIQATGQYRAITTSIVAGLQNEVPAAGSVNDFVAPSGSPPGTTPYTITAPGSVQYTPTLPNFVDIDYTHKYGPHGHTAKFEAVDTDTPIVESYFVVALGLASDTAADGYRCNAVCKTVFQSS